MYLYLGKMTN